jgi:hypothetical protein
MMHGNISDIYSNHCLAQTATDFSHNIRIIKVGGGLDDCMCALRGIS